MYDDEFTTAEMEAEMDAEGENEAVETPAQSAGEVAALPPGRTTSHPTPAGGGPAAPMCKQPHHLPSTTPRASAVSSAGASWAGVQLPRERDTFPSSTQGKLGGAVLVQRSLQRRRLAALGMGLRRWARSSGLLVAAEQRLTDIALLGDSRAEQKRGKALLGESRRSMRPRCVTKQASSSCY